MSFIGLIDYKSKDNLNSDNYLHLNVDADSGVDVTPNMEITVTDLNKSGSSLYKHFFNNGYGGITFKIDVLIKQTDTWNGKRVTDVVNDWFINMTPLAIVTEAIDVPDGRYIITDNSSRKQTFKGSTLWSMEFTTYAPLQLYRYKNDNAAVLKAIKKAKKATSKSKKKSTTNTKFAKCFWGIMVYSKKKKVVKCVKYLQKVLYKQKLLKKSQIDGWYGPATKKAVKKFQKNYNKKNKITINVKNGQSLPTGKKLLSKRLPVTGKMDFETFKALRDA